MIKVISIWRAADSETFQLVVQGFQITLKSEIKSFVKNSTPRFPVKCQYDREDNWE